MSNAITQELVQYFLQLDEAEQKSVLQMLKTFVGGRKEFVETITVEQYNKELEKAERQIDEGKFTTQEDLEEEVKQW